jgi:hypothetical protein
MNQEEKNLLLQDLCARLPYGVKVNHLLDIKPSDLFAIDTYRSTLYCFRNGREEWYKVEFIKPYLRQLSSMTDEEEDEYEIIIRSSLTTHIDWLNKYHFDYRDLIQMGLALEAPEGMYNN